MVLVTVAAGETNAAGEASKHHKGQAMDEGSKGEVLGEMDVMTDAPDPSATTIER